MGRNVEEFSNFDSLTGGGLKQICAEAASFRDQYWGKTITYSRKVFVPLTNYCRDECGYCTFVKRPGEDGARIMTPEQVMKVVSGGMEVKAKEVLFSLGEKPELRYEQVRKELAGLGFNTMIEYLHAICARVLKESSLLPHVNAGTLSESDLRLLKPVSASMGMMLENISRRLNRPGNAHFSCPDKVPVQRLRTLERAGKLSVPFTTGILIGIGETWLERLETLSAIASLHKRYGHIQEVIVQNFRAKPGTLMQNFKEPDHEDMLRTIAVARLMLPLEISLQAPPNLSEKYLDYIDSGINDWGGISPLTMDYINPECAWPMIDTLASDLEEKGYKLSERLTVYPRYVEKSHEFLDPGLSGKIEVLMQSSEIEGRVR